MTKPPPFTSPSGATEASTQHRELRTHPVRNGLVAFVVAAVWPLLLGWLGWSMGLYSSDMNGEWVLLFGGVSMIFLLPVAYFAPQQAELVTMFLVPLFWLAAAFLPPYFLRRKAASKLVLYLMLLGISGFSLCQALVGLFMLATMNV